MGFTINGTGTTFLGISAADEKGESLATLWITFLFFPIFPIRRQRVIFLEQKGSGYTYAILGDLPLDLSSVTKTYAYCWLLIPFLAASPAIPSFLGLEETFGFGSAAETVYMVALILYEIALLIIVVRRHERNTRPPQTVPQNTKK